MMGNPGGMGTVAVSEIVTVTNSSGDLADDDVQRVASIPADAPPPFCCSMCPNLLRSRKVRCSGR
jgi:hypothetical protein